MQRSGAVVLIGCLVVTATTATSTIARATGPHAARAIQADALTALPAAGVAKPLRAQRDVRWSMAAAPDRGAAWQKLAATGTWHASWDRATGVPSRIWGAGLAAPGAMASPAIAERFARAALAEHIALLAPGASPDDFSLAANSSDGDVRAVGFVQTHGGLTVVGGQVSFRFKRDRLVMIASQALPHVVVPPAPRFRMAAAVLGARVAANLRSALDLASAPVTPPGAEVVLPLVADDAVLGYRLAVPSTIDGGADGRYLAYSDPASGAVLAVQQMNLFTTGTVLYHAVDRYPATMSAPRPRKDRPLPLVHVMLDGASQTTTTAGQLVWNDSLPHTVTTSVIGDLVAIVNKSGSGSLTSAQLSFPGDGGPVVWDPSATPEDDAQVQTYLSVNLAKDFARVLDAQLQTLGSQITANVNIAQDCNAYFDGKAVNFFHASSRCQNTGLIQDVVFHEFGHSVHTAEIIPGVGAFDGAMSEGAADFFAVQITGDHGMGRGFFYTDEPLRDLDPPDSEARWPEDIGEIHKTGMIFGGTFWDLRKALIASLQDEQAGIALTQKLFIGALRRSIGIPDSLLEVLITDDDDGNLDNGTPHECEIRNAYGAHGLRTATGTIAAPDRIADATATTDVQIALTGLATRCAGDAIQRTDLLWQPTSPGAVASGSTMATPVSGTEFSATLPLVPNSTVLYQARVTFMDGSVLTLPDNLADPYYQLYQGRTMPLYCTNFETGSPLMDGWSTATGDGSPSPWTWGTPTSGATDPPAAYSGTHALVQVLDGDYAPQSASFVRMPTIDVGHWSDVHLQYRRWLAVEDSHYDKARVTVGGKQAWINATQGAGDSSSLQHIDREWRFQDVPISGYQPGHTVDIAWDLTSDEGLQFGGWALDDVCVVANLDSICGDGVVSAHEECDDGAGNTDAPNACRTFCLKPACGDGIVDDGEECDHGGSGDGECTAKCEVVGPPSLGGCCSAERGAGGSAFTLGALVIGLVRRRRRRAR